MEARTIKKFKDLKQGLLKACYAWGASITIPLWVFVGFSIFHNITGVSIVPWKVLLLSLIAWVGDAAYRSNKWDKLNG